MPESTSRLRMLTTAMVVAASLSAQSDLQARLIAIARLQGISAEQTAQQELAKLDLAKVPIADLVAALQNDTPLLRGLGWLRISAPVLARQQELMQFWYAHQQARQSTTELFALLPVDWVRVHAKGGPQQRADIEALAQRLPFAPKRLTQMRVDDPAIAASAATVQRIAAKAAIIKPDAQLTAMLEQAPGTPAVLANQGDPFVIGAQMPDAAPPARAAAALLIRQHLKLPVPISVTTACSLHANQWLRMRCISIRPTDEQLQQCVVAASQGVGVDLILRGDLSLLSTAAKRTAASELIRIGVQLPIVPVFKIGVQTLQAQDAFTAAMRLDSEAAMELAQHALAATDPQVQQRDLKGIHAAFATLRNSNLTSTPIDATILDRLTEQLLPLLDHPNPEVSLATAVLIHNLATNNLATKGATPAARNELIRRAAKMVTNHPERLRSRRRATIICTPDDQLASGPINTESLIVMTACTMAATELIDPLCAALLQAEPNGDSMQFDFLWHCLAQLAPHGTEQQASRIWQLVQDTKSGAPWVQGIAIRVYGTVPEDELDSIESLPNFVAGNVWHAELPQLSKDSVLALPTEAMPEARVRRLLKLTSIAHPYATSLYARCPDLILRAWQEGTETERSAAVFVLARTWDNHPEATLPLLLTWPKPFVIQALSMRSQKTMPLQLVQHLRSEPMREHQLAQMLMQCTIEASDRDNLVAMAADVDATASLSILGRLLEIPDGGEQAAVQLANKLLANQDDYVASSALSVMLRLNLRNCDWQPAVNRLSGDHGVLADAVRVQFGNLPLGECTSNQSHVLSAIKTSSPVATLRALPLDLDYLASACNAIEPNNAAAVFELVAEQTTWSQRMEDAVLQATESKHAVVRRAAYAALAKRDRELWPSAWLAYEAALDPDPTVRAVAPDADRTTNK